MGNASVESLTTFSLLPPTKVAERGTELFEGIGRFLCAHHQHFQALDSNDDVGGASLLETAFRL